MSTLMKQRIATIGAGRTDTGVHARMFYAHFDCATHPREMDYKGLAYKLNRLLPKDIAIQSVFPVHSEAHARFDALSRTYHYLICTRKDPFYIGRAWLMERPLNFDAMQEATAFLLNHSDFSAFARSNTQTRTNLCRLMKVSWHEERNLLLFEIRADRFLRNMVRAIVGTLVDVGLGRINPEGFNLIIGSHDRKKAGYSAPACGLYLVDVEYPDLSGKTAT